MQAQKNELADLDKLYSSISVAGDSKITITMEELDEYINEKVEVQLNEKLKDVNSMRLTGIKQDTCLEYKMTNGGNFNFNKMKMTEQGNIGEYLLYSEENEDYTVLKSGFYFVKIYAQVGGNNGAKDSSMGFYINGNGIVSIYSWANKGEVDCNSNSGPIYLEKGDKIY